MALTKVRGGGVDNPLTLGGGSASDRSIVFDGNAQDFHIGLDDSTDSFNNRSWLYIRNKFSYRCQL